MLYEHLDDDVEQIRKHAAVRREFGRIDAVVRFEDSGFILAGRNDRVSAAAVLIALNRGYIVRTSAESYSAAAAASKGNGGGILVDALPKAA